MRRRLSRQCSRRYGTIRWAWLAARGRNVSVNSISARTDTHGDCVASTDRAARDWHVSDDFRARHKVHRDFRSSRAGNSAAAWGSGRSELEYRLAWARTGLKRAGFLENSGRGVWSVTETGAIANETTVKAAIVAQRKLDAEGRIVRVANDANEDGIEDEDWQDRLLRVLKSISPDAFERLAKRLLRESGFTKVEVTGRSGDQGIDGTGILQLNLISFPVLFQCKRYEGSVGPGAIRDFRGAMMGRSDKGLFITTGSFTAEAKKEGTRDGAPSIELIDGPLLCDLLKKLGLGVVIRMVEVVEPDGEWFKQL